MLQDISEKLTSAIAPMGSVRGLGTRSPGFTPYGAGDVAFTARQADLLADHDDAFLAACVDDETTVSYSQLRRQFAAVARQGLVHPVFFGSAITGAGVDSLTAGINELLPAAESDADGPVSGAVFKVERGPAGEKIAYVRMFSGTLRSRDRVHVGRDSEGKITAVSVFDRGSAVQRASVAAGQIGKLWGLVDIQIGDTLGVSRTTPARHYFAPPTLETVVVPCRPADKGARKLISEREYRRPAMRQLVARMAGAESPPLSAGRRPSPSTIIAARPLAPRARQPFTAPHRARIMWPAVRGPR